MSSYKNAITKEAKNIKKSLILADMAIIVLGVLMVVFPERSGDFICRAVGAILCVMGIFRVIAYFAYDRSELFGSFALVQGAAFIGFGVYFLARPQFLAAFLTVALALVLIIGGVMKLQYAIDLARMGSSLWWIELIGAIVMTALGVVTFLDPFEAASGLMIFIGISFLVDGIWDMISVLWLSKAVKRLKHAVEKEADNIRTEQSAVDVDYTDVQ